LKYNIIIRKQWKRGRQVSTLRKMQKLMYLDVISLRAL